MKISNSINIINKKETFNGKADVHRRVSRFVFDFLNLSQSEQLSFRKIEKLTKQHLPGIVILSKMDNRSSINASCSFLPKYNKNTGKYYVASHCINLPKINFLSQRQKLNFTEMFIHEVTHAFQNVDKDMSFVTLLNKYLKKNGVTKTNEVQNISSRVVERFERDFIGEAFDLLKLPKNIESIFTAQTPNSLFNKMNSNKVDFIKFFQEKIDFTLRKGKKEYPDFDEKFFLQNLKNLAVTEEDAYREGAMAVKLLEGIDDITIEEATPVLYKKLSQAIDKFKS